MRKKIILRICFTGLFLAGTYLIDAYIRKGASFVSLAVGSLILVETALIMFKNYEKY